MGGRKRGMGGRMEGKGRKINTRPFKMILL